MGDGDAVDGADVDTRDMCDGCGCEEGRTMLSSISTFTDTVQTRRPTHDLGLPRNEYICTARERFTGRTTATTTTLSLSAKSNIRLQVYRAFNAPPPRPPHLASTSSTHPGSRRARRRWVFNKEEGWKITVAAYIPNPHLPGSCVHAAKTSIPSFCSTGALNERNRISVNAARVGEEAK